MACPNDAIAVFDSGVGGISVLRELVALMPEENFLYFGDSANAPYGEKTTGEVRQLTLHHANRLLSRNIKALVVACNTATSAAIDELRKQYPGTIIVGIEPALKPAVEQFPHGTIGIMATQVTLREEKLSHLQEHFPQAQVVRIKAIGLVEAIEQGDWENAQALLSQILTPYIGKLDALVLGCTHYPFVRQAISRILGEKTVLFDGGAGTARQTRRCLKDAGLLRAGQGSVTIENSLGTAEILARSFALLEG